MYRWVIIASLLIGISQPVRAQIPGRSIYGADATGTFRPVRTDTSGNLVVAQTGGSATELDDADAVTGWAVVNDDAENIALNTDSVEGSGSLDYDKANGTANTAYALIDKTITSTNLTSLGIGTVIIQVPFKIPTLTNVTAVVLRIGTDASNYNEYQVSTTDWTANAWEVAQFVLNETAQASVGTGYDMTAITYIAVGTRFSVETNTLANMQVDAMVAIAPLTIANIDAGVLSSIQASSSNTSDQMDALLASVPVDGTHDSAVTATGPQIMAESKDLDGAAWTAVDAEADTVRPAASREGVLAVQLVSEDGARTYDPCMLGSKSFVSVDIVTATTTEIINQSSGNKAYICSMFLFSAGANNVALVEDTTDACANPDAGMAGGTTAAEGINLAANQGFTFGSGAGTVAVSASANVNVCLITSAAVQLSGVVGYVLAP